MPSNVLNQAREEMQSVIHLCLKQGPHIPKRPAPSTLLDLLLVDQVLQVDFPSHEVLPLH